MNDVNSVHWAIVANLEEYLHYEGVVEESNTSLKVLAFQALTIAFSGVVFLCRKMEMTALPFAYIVVAFTIFVGMQFLYNVKQGNRDVIFIGMLQPSDDKLEQKKWKNHLKGKRLCVRLRHADICVPVATLEMQFIGRSKLFSPPSVLCRVEREIAYGKFFGSSGFFFPPSFTACVDEVLRELCSRKKKK